MTLTIQTAHLMKMATPVAGMTLRAKNPDDVYARIENLFWIIGEDEDTSLFDGPPDTAVFTLYDMDAINIPQYGMMYWETPSPDMFVISTYAVSMRCDRWLETEHRDQQYTAVAAQFVSTYVERVDDEEHFYLPDLPLTPEIGSRGFLIEDAYSPAITEMFKQHGSDLGIL